MTDEPSHPSSDNRASFDPAANDQVSFDPAILAQLACPACHGGLHLEGTRLRCMGCSRAYPIADNIPVMIIERAGRPGEES